MRDYVCQAYAGKGPGKNNPDMQDVHDVGPLPVGGYTIGAPYQHPRLGHFVMALTPDPATQLYDRSGFFIHGPNPLRPLESSDGCIVAPLDDRERIFESSDSDLLVVSGRTGGEDVH